MPLLRAPSTRAALAEQPEKFLSLIREQIVKTPANFEVFSFAVLKVHLEKFACKIYRDTRTAAHDKGVDLSTNFGVVYQIKKLQIKTQSEADLVYAELKMNFDSERLSDGNVILVIDDISKDVKQFLINMKVQSISKDEVLNLAANFNEPEDRQKVLRIVSDEFSRDYSSRIAPFVHPKLTLAARLELGRGARPSRWPFSASRCKPPGARIVPIRSAPPDQPALKSFQPSLVMPPAASWDNSRSAAFARQKCNRPLPCSSTPNCLWPHGWDFAGERARPGGRFRRRA